MIDSQHKSFSSDCIRIPYPWAVKNQRVDQHRERETTLKMAVLGDDGRGFELARKLESCGIWRTWLGDSLYSTFAHFLSSPSAWEAFMATDDSKSKSKAHIQLQLRVRALLFDKAAFSLFLPPPVSLSSSSIVSLLNSSCKLLILISPLSSILT